MNSEIDHASFQRFVRGQASPSEARAVRQWLAEPGHELLATYWMSQHAAELEAEDTTATAYDYASRRQALHTRLGMGASPELPATQPAWSGARRWVAAASVTAMVAAGGWLWHGQHPAAALATAHFATGVGQVRQVQLPDGSVAMLNANSTLRYAASSAAATPREVWLDGEGFFQVKHLPDSRPFVVHTTAGLDVRVLGTRFTVYRRHEQARVVLLSGKVRVDFADTTRRAVLLKPGELLRAIDHSRTVEHRAVAAADYADWTTGQLVFDGTSLAEVALRLQDLYGVTVVAKNPALLQRRFTGVFALGNLDRLCENLTESFHLRIVRRQQRLLLSELPGPPDKSAR
jgi:transmembrane sensor